MSTLSCGRTVQGSEELPQGEPRREEEEEEGEVREMVPPSGPESLSRKREDAESSQGKGKDGRDAGAQGQAWPRALTALPCPAPTLAVPKASVSWPPALPKQSQPRASARGAGCHSCCSGSAWSLCGG